MPSNSSSMFQERAEFVKRKVKDAMIYPVFVVGIAVLILTMIMIFIVPQFREIFDEFDLEFAANDRTCWCRCRTGRSTLVPRLTYQYLAIHQACPNPWLGPVHHQDPDLRPVVRKEHRTLGTLVASGVPILEARTSPRHRRQRRVRADVQPHQRGDSRGSRSPSQ